MKIRKIKPTVIAALLGTTPFICAMAAEDAEDSFFDNVGISLGGGVQYDVKNTVDWFASNAVSDYSSVAQLGKVTLNLPGNALAVYGLNRVNYTSSTGSRNGLRHEVLIGKNFPIGMDGLTGGLYYSGSLEETDLSTSTKSGFKEDLTTHSIQPSLNYYSNAGKWGVYTQLSQSQATDNSDQTWTTDKQKLSKDTSSLLIEPSKTYGSWILSTQLYFSDTKSKTDLGSTRADESTFTEKYIQPQVSYGFENAGVLTVSYRISDQTTTVTGGAWQAAGTNYFDNVRKLTVGYSQSVGPWALEGRVRRSWQTEVSNASWSTGKHKEINVDHLEAFATYRF
jgi:hypothetical protein